MRTESTLWIEIQVMEFDREKQVIGFNLILKPQKFMYIIFQYHLPKVR
jgi:hypothetical protein